jgi:hypothetical protein
MQNHHFPLSPSCAPPSATATALRAGAGQACLSLLLLTLGACTGVVDGVAGNGSNAGGSLGSGGGASGGGPNVEGSRPQVSVATPRLTRLSRRQWENSLRELLKLDDIADVTSLVAGDALVGFDTEAEALRVGEQLRSDLDKASRSLAERVASDPSALSRIMPAAAPAEVTAKARAFIDHFGLRAYRRPVTEAEAQSLLALFANAATLYPDDDAFTGGVKLLLSAFLQSPHFLYRSELSTTPVDGKVALSPYEVAAKLSLTLTNMPPDEPLLAAAAANGLATREQIAAHAVRLLESPAGDAGRDHFHFQIYRLGAYDGIVRSPTSFPDFTPATPGAMRAETLAFMRYVFSQNLGVAGIFTTPVAFVNDSLAPLYGLPAMTGSELRRVDLDPAERSGLLTLAGVLSQYAVVDDPDTIHRGVFVNQRILCRELPPPDPNAGMLPTVDEGMTNRERVEATTGPGTCGAGCHSTVINPPGFAFEKFDAIGRSRTMDRGKPIDASASYAFGDGLKSFDGAVEFSQLVAQSPEAHACYIENWMSYLNGRVVSAAEQPLLDHLTEVSLKGELSMKELLVDLVTGDDFLKRLP